MIRSIVIKIAGGILAAAVLAACTLMPETRSEQTAAEATPTPIPTAQIAVKPTYKVQRGEVVKSLQFSGRIAPSREEELFFRTDGRVRSVSFKRNDKVKQGDVVAELEIDALERELNAAELELERAQVTLAEAERTLDLDRREAQTRLEQAQIVLQGMDRDHQHTRAEISAQEKQVELAQIAVERLGAGVSLLLQNDVQRASYAVQKLNQEIAEAQIIAPFDGVLLSLTLTPGQAVTGYAPVASVADPSQTEVSADLLSNQLQLLAEKMPVTFVLSSKPGQTFHGVIRRLPYPFGSGGTGQTIEDKDKSTRIAMTEAPAAAAYALGDLVRVTAEIDRAADVLWLPPQAIRNFNGRLFVVIQEGEVQRRADVRVGIEAEERVELEEGVTEGETVVGP